MNIRTATIEDLNIITAVEKECFPPNEAATAKEFEERLKVYADHFWLLFDGDRLVSFVDGFATDERDLTDRHLSIRHTFKNADPERFLKEYC